MKKRIINSENKTKTDLFSNTWKMLLACIIPLALLLILPIIGISNNLFVLVAIILMVVFHVLMVKEALFHNKSKMLIKMKGGEK